MGGAYVPSNQSMECVEMTQAINNYVIVKEDKEEETTSSGIVISTSIASELVTADVISAGEDVKYITGGEKIMFLRQNSKEVALYGELLIAVMAENIILKL